jgi:cleavage and polyadenylation specificity factor subunit 1
LAKFTSDLRHTSGRSNVVVDTLSRPPTTSGSVSGSAAVGIKSPAIAKPEASDLHANNLSPKTLPPANSSSPDEPLINAVPAQSPTAAIDFAGPDMNKSPSLNIAARPIGDAQLLGHVSTSAFRPLVPAPFRETIIRSLHNVQHPGIRATSRLVKASYCWSKMEKDITAVACS